MDAFKRNIAGFRGHRTPSTAPGQTCPCCRETTKRQSRPLARARLKAADRTDPEGVASLSRMAPWEREHGEGAPEPCDDPRCDCGWASDPLVQNVEHRTEPLTATLAEMAA